MIRRSYIPALRVACAIGIAAALAACSSGRPVPGPTPAQKVDIGYGTAAKADLTGSVDQVGADEIEASHAVRLEDALEGRVAGVRVIRTASGGISVQIRGQSSIYGPSDPLYVVDGVPVRTMPGQGLIGLNPGDIASVTVLKDAGATAIYGSRGGNGVVLITTKRGH
ncbi:MAG TPA: TonB-dependent receptor plug domain-containing protein [Longimicrobiaceae bacterium]|nr:TonB-dependent receptor plug domain-containing protein [Longimicrobiaceae bacterium]